MADVGSRDAKVRVAFHLSKLPARGLDDAVLKRIELWMGVTWKTGTCARDSGHNIALTSTRQSTDSRITRVSMRAAFLSTVNASYKSRQSVPFEPGKAPTRDSNRLDAGLDFNPESPCDTFTVRWIGTPAILDVPA